MADTKNLIQNSLLYYDKNVQKYEKFFNRVKYKKFTYAKHELEHSTVTFYDADKKELFTSRLEVIGTYNKETSIWIWAWANAGFHKNYTTISRKILNYGLDIDTSVGDNFFLKSELVTSRFKINNMIQLELHIALASYLSKHPLIYNIFYQRGSDIVDTIQKEPKYTMDENYQMHACFLLDHDKIDFLE